MTTTTTYTTEQQLLRALQVLVLTDHIRHYLVANDPKALEQAEAALSAAGAPYPRCGATSGLQVCDRRVGHDGAHGCFADTAWGRRRTGWWQGGATR